MIRELLAIICLLGTTNVIAQANKNTEKQADATIDYKQPGAPMPRLLLVTAYDTGVVAGTDTSLHKKYKGHKAVKSVQSKDKTLHQEFVTNADLDNGASLFVMMFNPTCSHCEDETKLITKNNALFKKSKVVLLAAPLMKPYLPDFIRSFRLDDYPGIYIGTDSMGFIGNVFLYSALPQINVYDGKRKLLRIFAGEVEIDSLKQFIQ